MVGEFFVNNEGNHYFRKICCTGPSIYLAEFLKARWHWEGCE